MIPARVSDQALVACSRFRTKERVPSITYYYKKTKTVIARSSQSKVYLNVWREMLTKIAWHYTSKMS